MCSVCDKVYKILRNLPESMSRASPPHLTHNNPLMNDSGFTCSSPPPAPECHLDGLDRDKKLRHHIPEQKLGQLLNDNDKFPFINQAGLDLDMRKSYEKLSQRQVSGRSSLVNSLTTTMSFGLNMLMSL